jgi:mono/diheme cytochrome c family protein
MNPMNAKNLVPCAAAGLLAVCLLALPACSARRSEPIAGPLGDSSPAVLRGEVAFDHYCSHCHPSGERGLAPALNNKPLPGFLIKFQVRHGLGSMPAFSERVIPPDELDAIVRYMKALRRQ